MCLNVLVTLILTDQSISQEYWKWLNLQHNAQLQFVTPQVARDDIPWIMHAHCTKQAWKKNDFTFLQAFVVQRLPWKIVQSSSVQFGKKHQLILLFMHIFLSLTKELPYHLPRFPIPLAPVHRSRKFSAVFGTTSVKSSQTWAETRKGRKNIPTIFRYLPPVSIAMALPSSILKSSQILPLRS